jgi:hypothetical protein
VNWIYLAREMGPAVVSFEDDNEPSGFIKF